jgi:NTP pyrophosphatase (non-canonical NTP hydrolase)
MNKWIPISYPKHIRRLGKLSEECGELVQVASRCLIQGLHGVNPETGKLNIEHLLDELSDVQAQIGCTLLTFELDQDYLARRVAKKIRQMVEWESFFNEELGE